jgi:uncharacterized protein with PQ loop repeat
MYGILLSWILAIISNVIWLLVFIPQLIEHYKTKSADSISYSLILLWFIGDSICLISIKYKELGNLLWYINIYHVFFDMIFILQVLYYRLKSKGLIYFEIDELNESAPLLAKSKFVFGSWQGKLTIIKNVIKHVEVYSLLLSIIIINLIQIVIGAINLTNENLHMIGDIFAWLTLIICIMSRFPQIILNYNKKNVDGLSSMTFTTIILANNLFLASILIALLDIEDRYDYFINNIQFILSSIGTTILDMIILIQMLIYKKMPTDRILICESQSTQTEEEDQYDATVFDYQYDY